MMTAPSKDGTYQDRVKTWLLACFGAEISADRLERADRLLEEVFELLQSGGYNPERVLALRDYVWSRPVGEPHQETGGVMMTLAAYCQAHDIDMERAAEDELARVWTKVEKIRAKQAAKPTGSALPQKWASGAAGAPGSTVTDLELARICEHYAKHSIVLRLAAELQMHRKDYQPGADPIGVATDNS